MWTLRGVPLDSSCNMTIMRAHTERIDVRTRGGSLLPPCLYVPTKTEDRFGLDGSLGRQVPTCLSPLECAELCLPCRGAAVGAGRSPLAAFESRRHELHHSHMQPWQ